MSNNIDIRTSSFLSNRFSKFSLFLDTVSRGKEFDPYCCGAMKVNEPRRRKTKDQ